MSTPFEMQPTLCDDLVELRPLAGDDFEPLFAIASDPRIWEQHHTKNKFEKAEFEKFFTKLINSKGAFAIIDKKNNNVIGTCRFYKCNYVKSEIEIGGVFLAREYWGGDWNKSILKLMLEHAYRFVRRVFFLVDYENLRAQASLEKHGAVKSRDRKSSDGKLFHCYIITKESFEA
jgi:RimJ/RimL family protein N-acetyltransferase